MFIIIAIVAPKPKPTTAAGTPTASAAAPAAASPATAAVPGIGHVVRDGDFAFTVESVSCGAAAAAAVGGSDGFGETVPSGAQECIATIRVTDDKGGAQTWFDSNQYAYDAAARKFSADTNAPIYLAGDQDAKQLNPGITVTAPVPFQIPSGDKITKLELHDSAFSGGVTVGI